MLQKIKRQDQGFTIIEVLIVLAIAGLIMLIVFLAVPALQRNARNTSRRDDVSKLLGAVSEYIANNNGSLPATAASGDFKDAFTGVYPNLGFYTTATNITYTNNASAPASASSDPASLDKVAVYNFETCSNNAASLTGGSSRSVIALFDIETSGGGTTEQCVSS